MIDSVHEYILCSALIASLPLCVLIFTHLSRYLFAFNKCSRP